MVSFSFPRKELLQLLRQLKQPVTVRRNDVYFMRCELIATPTKVIFKLPGNEVYLNVQPIGCCKAEFYFKDVYDVLRTMEEKDVSVFIQDKTIKLNEVTLSAKIEQFTKGSIQQQVELPMDFLNEDSNDLFTQKIVKSKDYQSKDGSRHYSDYEISKDIEHVHARLKKYNIEYRMIEQFVKRNLMRV
jgi:hypothetical protein